MRTAIDYTGSVIGFVTVIGVAKDAEGRVDRDRDGHKRWEILCVCGARVTKSGATLRGAVTHSRAFSCGCRSNMSKRGERKVTEHPLYRIWIDLRRRCYHRGRPSYKYYGGRGITVCEEWDRSFAAFLRDMEGGYRPGLTIDRINNDGPYAPDNCRWATPREQANNCSANRRITTERGDMTIGEAAYASGIKYHTLYDRAVRSKWGAEGDLRSLFSQPRASRSSAAARPLVDFDEK